MGTKINVPTRSKITGINIFVGTFGPHNLGFTRTTHTPVSHLLFAHRYCRRFDCRESFSILLLFPCMHRGGWAVVQKVPISQFSWASYSPIENIHLTVNEYKYWLESSIYHTYRGVGYLVHFSFKKPNLEKQTCHLRTHFPHNV